MIFKKYIKFGFRKHIWKFVPKHVTGTSLSAWSIMSDFELRRVKKYEHFCGGFPPPTPSGWIGLMVLIWQLWKTGIDEVMFFFVISILLIIFPSSDSHWLNVIWPSSMLSIIFIRSKSFSLAETGTTSGDNRGGRTLLLGVSLVHNFFWDFNAWQKIVHGHSHNNFFVCWHILVDCQGLHTFVTSYWHNLLWRKLISTQELWYQLSEWNDLYK